MNQTATTKLPRSPRRWRAARCGLVVVCAALTGPLGGCALSRKDKPAASAAARADADAGSTSRGAAAPVATTRPAIAVLERYVEVTGGRSAYEQLNSRVTTSRISGTFLLMPVSGEFTTHQKHPNKLHTEGRFRFLGREVRFTAATDGRVAWQKTSWGGMQLLEGVRRDSFIRQADLRMLLRPEAHYSRMEWKGQAEFDGVLCDRLELRDLDGAIETRYYVWDTGLLEGYTARGRSGGQFALYVRAYRTVGRIVEPSRYELTILGGRFTWDIESIAHDVDIDDALFAPPEQ